MGCDIISWYCTWVVAVEVVLLLDPHICWNCTLISANVSMMTAINTFWKKITNHIYQRLGRREGNPNLKQKIGRSCQKTQVLLLGNTDEFWQYLHKPRKEEYESNEIEVGTPAGKAVNGSVHEEHPALLGGGLVDGEDTGAWQERGEQAELWWTFDIKTHFPEAQSILIHYHFLNDLLKG